LELNQDQKRVLEALICLGLLNVMSAADYLIPCSTLIYLNIYRH